jgi:hypothetical protein
MTPKPFPKNGFPRLASDWCSMLIARPTPEKFPHFVTLPAACAISAKLIGTFWSAGILLGCECMQTDDQQVVTASSPSLG